MAPIAARSGNVSSAPDSDPVDARLRLAVALSLTSILLFAFHAFFVSLSATIVAARLPTEAARVTGWARWGVEHPDGLEAPFALVGMIAFVGGSVTTALFSVTFRRTAIASISCVAGIVFTILIVVSTRSSEFLPPDDSRSAVLMLILGICLWLMVAGERFLEGNWRVIAGAGFGILLATAILLSLGDASTIDYSYYIAPALKHLRGERFGSFYMQYDALGTWMFEGMLMLGLNLQQMQFAMAVELVAWFGLYWLLIRRLFNRQSIGFLLFVALIVVRFLDIRDHPAYCPQTMPHRLEMWVPLLLLSLRWGVDSLKTSVAVAAAYALNSTFGLLSAAAYVVVLLVKMTQRDDKGRTARALRLAALAMPLAVAAALNAVVFGAVVSPAAAYYLDVQLGFIPISPTSLFWPIALLLGWATTVFVFHRDERSSRYGLFICVLAVVHLTYFFGRSHDHNLLNLSSVWLFATFLALDQARELQGVAPRVGVGLIVFFAFMGARESTPKLARIGNHLQRGVWLNEHPIEKRVDAYRALAMPNVVPLELDDAYLNYRLKLPQRGFFAPLNAFVFVEDAAAFLDDELGSQPLVITLNSSMPAWIEDLNRADVLKARGHRFVSYPYGTSGFVAFRRERRE